MEILSSSDVLLLQAGALGASAFAANLLWSKYLRTSKFVKPNLPLLQAAKSAEPSILQPTRSIIKQLEQTKKDCIVFYGSQTGTAERFANRFSREALARYNLGCEVASLDDYDFGDLGKLTKKHLVVFILATYGEGEPTDNAIPFQKYLEGLCHEGLNQLRYGAFGLGSTSYTQYNAMIRRVDDVLTAHHAQRIGGLGLGDDGKGSLEEDFVQWTRATLTSMSTTYEIREVAYQYEPSFKVAESAGLEIVPRDVFLGEPNTAHLLGRIKGPFTGSNPFPAPIITTQELFTSPERNCLHMQFDVSGTNINYDTGDHLAIWPINADGQVDLFLKCFGLSSKRAYTIKIKAADPSTKIPIPALTTYETAVRHYLDICTVVTRQMIRQILPFVGIDTVRTRLNQLVDNVNDFSGGVTEKKLTIAQLLSQLCTEENISLTEVIVDLPFSLVLEIIPRLRQRYYSISSSSLVTPQAISITAVVDSVQDAAKGIDFHGVSTSYLSAIKDECSFETSSSGRPPTHNLKLSRKASTQVPHALVHVRTSRFRPPFQPSTPIIMIGPGSGVAPFLAFVQERALQYSQGRKVGQTLLFYGCRRSDEDFLYRQVWEEIQQNERLGKDAFSMYTAFSREPSAKKTYVQDLIIRQSTLLANLLWHQNARVYICGNANRMAKDVGKAFAKIFGHGDDSESLSAGFSKIEELKRAGRWCEDVW